MVSSYDLDEIGVTSADFLNEFYKESSLQFRNLIFQFMKRSLFGFFNIYFIWMTVYAIYSTFTNMSSYYEQAMTPNLPFCEAPFAMTPYMAQGASAMAHFPYVPLLLLGIFYTSPDTIPSFVGDKSNQIRNILLVQTALQLFTSVGGHMLPNPRMVLNQEISIAVAFLLLYSFFDLTTPEKNRWIIDFGTFASVGFLSIVGYLWFGLMPVIFTVFAASLAMSYTIKDAFGLLTPYGKSTRLYIFVPTATVLAVETVACDWLLANVSYLLPWHLLFDILFWQVLGSAIDVIVISPVPGRFMVDDKIE